MKLNVNNVYILNITNLKGIKLKYIMKFTLNELEIIKDALTVALVYCMDKLNDPALVIDILEMIDEEAELD
jgi:hypothetical protein